MTDHVAEAQVDVVHGLADARMHRGFHLAPHLIGMLFVERHPEIADLAHRVDVEVDIEARAQRRRRGIIVLYNLMSLKSGWDKRYILRLHLEISKKRIVIRLSSR